jgi:hypothetical protein
LLAAMTVSAMNVAIMAWYRGNYSDLSAAVEQVFSRLTRIVCDQAKPNAGETARTSRLAIMKP